MISHIEYITPSFLILFDIIDVWMVCVDFTTAAFDIVVVQCNIMFLTRCILYSATCGWSFHSLACFLFLGMLL